MSLDPDIRLGYTAKIEEIDVRVLESRVLLHRHSTKDTTAQVTSSLHHIICVTLKDVTLGLSILLGLSIFRISLYFPSSRTRKTSPSKMMALSPCKFTTAARIASAIV
jgi:hypothetical protein